MNILVIGNGFDLAHGLPTKYTDFLKYCSNYNDIEEHVSDLTALNKEFLSFCNNNFWLQYFFCMKPNVNENDTWIDFENEIAEAIKKIEKYDIEIDDSKEIKSLRNNLFTEIYNKCSNVKCKDNTFDKYIYSQLRQFARAFEIYCLKVNKTIIVRPICTQRKEDIEKAKNKMESYGRQAYNASGYTGRQKEVEKYEKLRNEACNTYSSLYSGISPIDYLSMSKFDCVLSFNYTNTYERLYGNDKTKYCYIHGTAQENKDKTNIIFGIDDDLESGKESKDFRWIRFKKYYQRVIFKTGSEYKDWISDSQQAKS